MAEENFPEEEKKREETNKETRGYVQYSGMAFEMFGTIFIGALVGWQLDKWLKMKTPIFTIFLSLIFLGIAFYRIYKSLGKNE